MAKRRFILLFAFSAITLAVVLSFSSEALAHSINNLETNDSAFQLFAITRGRIESLLPNTVLYADSGSGILTFGTGLPADWMAGDLTTTVSFDDLKFTEAYGLVTRPTGCTSPTMLCLEFQIPVQEVTKRFPATLTVSFSGQNGATVSDPFRIAPVPEPGSMLLFCTGTAFLAAKYRTHRFPAR